MTLQLSWRHKLRAPSRLYIRVLTYSLQKRKASSEDSSFLSFDVSNDFCILKQFLIAMSATTAETLGSDATLRVFSEKNPQRKNGYLSEKNSKEYLIEIVKEAIKEDILEEQEDEKDSTNLVVGKVVEVKDDLNVNVLNENRNVLVNGYKENNESLQTTEKFDVPEVNKTTKNENTKSTHVPDKDNLINSSGDHFSMDSLEKDSLPLKNFESESSERDVICLDKKSLVDSSDKLNIATTSNKNVKEDCLKFIQQEVKHCKQNSVSSHIPSVSESTIQSPCNSNQGDVHCDNQSQEIINSDVESNLPSNCEEDVLSKVQCIGDIDGGGSSSSIIDISKTEPAVEDNSYTNVAAGGQILSNATVESLTIETKFSEVNSLEVAANLVEKVDSPDSLEDETSNCFTLKESLSNPNTLSGENTNSSNIGICKVESKNKKLETDSENDQNQSSDENFSHHSAENKESVEVSSSRIEENVDKLDFGSKGFLKRPPRNRDENEELSKKCKFSGDELTTLTENNSKRRSSGGMSDFKSGTKKIRLSEDSNGSAEPGHIIVNGSNQKGAVDINTKSNENVMVKKLEEKMPDKKEKIKDSKKLNKDKLRTKELKKIKEKVDQKLDNNTFHLNGTIEKSSLNPSNTADVVESETSTKVSKLKLKKTKDLEDDEEYRLLNGPGINTCPLCNCSCKFKKNDRKILGEKTKAFVDVVSGNSENININLVQKLEELVGQTVADWATNKCEVGAVRRRAHYLEEEHDRLTQLTIHLKKQLDDARCIIKRIIDEKIAHKSWAEGIVPLKVTRSVGMQVCTAGSSHVLMKPLEHDKEPHRTTIASPIPTTKTNPVNSNSNKCSKGTSGNSNRTDDILMEAAPNVSSPHSSTAVTVPVAVKSRTEGIDKPKHILHSSLSNPKPVPQSATIPSCVVEDDLEVQVIEPSTDEKIKEKIIPGVSLPTVSVNTAMTSITSNTSTTGHLTSGIYLLNTPPVTGAAIRNTRQVSPNVPVTSASEIIDLTDNDHMAGQNNKTAVAMHAASRLAGPSNSRTSASQPNTKQSTLNLNAVTSANTITGSNKVVTFPADSTTTYMIQRSNNPNNTVVRKAVSQPSSSEETEVLLTSLSKLPPLPRAPKYGSNILKPPRPTLRICKNSTGIMLSWNFEDDLPTTIRKYQVYAYQEGAPVEGTKTEMWKKVGDVDALPLPMACTLTQFKEGHKYFFVVRAIDVNARLGDFSLPGSIMLTSSSSQSNATPRM